MEIKVLGPGCPNCNLLEETVKKAVAELGIDAKIEKVTDMLVIMKHTMSTLLVFGRLNQIQTRQECLENAGTWQTVRQMDTRW